jgi:hypothetical protein
VLFWTVKQYCWTYWWYKRNEKPEMQKTADICGAV